jgi:hypothetical protein
MCTYVAICSEIYFITKYGTIGCRILQVYYTHLNIPRLICDVLCVTPEAQNSDPHYYNWMFKFPRSTSENIKQMNVL